MKFFRGKGGKVVMAIISTVIGVGLIASTFPAGIF